MRVLRAAVFGAAAWTAATLPASAEVQLAMQDGRVTIVAKDATLRQILSEWARVGQTKVINIERVGGTPMTLQLTNVPEQEALDVLLRSVSGYLAAPRAASAPNLSRFDRILVMPTSVAPRVVAAPAALAPAQPTFQPAPAVAAAPPMPADPGDPVDERQQPATVTLPPPRGPVFSTFPAPQIVNPQTQPTTAAPPADQSVPAPPASFPGSSQPNVPFGGTPRPGMVVPAPPQPGQQPIAPAARPPEGN